MIVKRAAPEVLELARALSETVKRVFEDDDRSIERLTSAIARLPELGGFVLMNKTEIENLQDYRDSVTGSLQRILGCCRFHGHRV